MSYTLTEINLITLCSFGELTYKNRYELLSGFKSTEPDFAGNEQKLIKSLSRGVYNKVRELYSDRAYREKVLRGLEDKGIRCVTYFSDGYPTNLKNSELPPVTLYCKGNLSLLGGRCFSVVGSRRTLPNMLKTCERVAEELTSHFTVVSGIADGADAAALRGAERSGRAIAVLAHGFGYMYPAVNEELARKVERNGLLMTEYPPEVPPRSYNFPVRNRIIAALSEAVLVVSAAKRSGALITAAYALEYNRTVFAFPYSIGVSSGEGCNSLLKNGGIIAENILDIFSVFGLDFKSPQTPSLSGEEKELYALIKESDGAFVSVLAEKLGKAPFQLIPLISSLEIKGMIVRLGGNRYSAVNKSI